MPEQAGIEVVIQTSRAQDNIERLADSADDKIEEIRDRFDDLQESIDALNGDIDIEATVNLDDSAFDGFSDITDPEVTINIDDSEVISATADVEEIGTLEEEPVVAPDDTAVTDVETELEAIGDTEATPNITPDTAGQANIEKVTEDVNFLKNLAVIEIVMNVAGTLLDAIKAINDFTVAGFLDAGDAAARFEAQTGQSIENIIDTDAILYDDLGETRDQIARVAITASQLGVLPENIDGATRAALAFTKVFDDQSPTQTLETINQLVNQGLVEDFAEGADLLTVAFQDGANRGGDLQRVLTEFAPTFKEMGLDGAGAIDLINQGLEAGIPTAQQAVRAYSDLQDRVQLAAGDSGSDVNTALSALEMDNPAEEGQTVGADFIAGVNEGIRNYTGNEFTQDQLVEIFYGKQGKRFTDALIEEQDPATLLANQDWSGAAATAGQAFDDSFRGAIDDLWLYIDEQMNKFLSSEQIDLPGKLDAIKNGIQDAFEGLAAGETLVNALGGALEITLGVPGLQDKIASLENALVEVSIAILQAVQDLFIMGGKDDAAAAVGDVIAGIAGMDLAVQLEVANPDEIEGLVDKAFSRGVSSETIVAGLTDSVQKAIDAGDFTTAQNLIDRIDTLGTTDGVSVGGVNPYAVDIDAAQQQLDMARNLAELTRITAESAQDFTNNITEGARQAGSGILDRFLPQSGGKQTFTDQEALAVTRDQPDTSQIDMATGFVDQLSTATQNLTGGGDLFSTITTNIGTAAAAVTGQSPLIIDPLTQIGELAGTAYGGLTDGVTLLSSTLTEKAPAIAGDNQSIEHSIFSMKDDLKILKDIAKAYKDIADNAAAASAASGGNISGHAAGGIASRGDIVGEAGPEIVGSSSLGVLSTVNSRALIEAVNTYMAHAGMGGGTTNNNQSKSITVNQYISNGAQGLMADNAVSNAYRGYPD